jgi:enoyl-CoA hydratase/carnithine racemase
VKKVVRFERDGNVGIIVHADGPQNFIDNAFIRDGQEALREASASDIRALIIRCEGPNFGVGGNAGEWVGKDSNWFRTFLLDVCNLFKSIEALRIPTFAAVNGRAGGGGYEFAQHCDFIVVEEDTVLHAPETMVGMVPVAGGIQRMVAAAGLTRAKRLLFFPEPILGAKAVEYGLASHLAPKGKLQEYTMELAQKLANGPTRAFIATKAMLKTLTANSMADLLMAELTAELYGSQDVRNSFAALGGLSEEALKKPEEVFSGLVFSGR